MSKNNRMSSLEAYLTEDAGSPCEDASFTLSTDTSRRRSDARAVPCATRDLENHESVKDSTHTPGRADSDASFGGTETKSTAIVGTPGEDVAGVRERKRVCSATGHVGDSKGAQRAHLMHDAGSREALTLVRAARFGANSDLAAGVATPTEDDTVVAGDAVARCDCVASADRHGHRWIIGDGSHKCRPISSDAVGADSWEAELAVRVVAPREEFAVAGPRDTVRFGHTSIHDVLRAQRVHERGANEPTTERRRFERGRVFRECVAAQSELRRQPSGLAQPQRAGIAVDSIYGITLVALSRPESVEH